MPPRPAPLLPPRWLLRGIAVLRDLLLHLADRIVPAPVALLDHAFGLARSQALHVAARYRIADLLADGPASAAELAQRTGTNADLMDRTLRLLVTIGIFAFEGGRYRNNRLSEGLREATPGGGPWFAEYYGAPYRLQAWSRLGETVATGQSAFELAYGRSVWAWFGDHPSEGACFSAAMQRTTELTAADLARGYPFAEVKTLCDIAGGQGFLLAAVLQHHGHLRGILFDDAAVIERSVLAEHGVADRCERVAGSFFEAIPPGADGYLLKDILHDWDDEVCLTILRNARTAAAPGARLLLVEMLVEGDGLDRFLRAADLEVAVICSRGRQRSASELGRLLDESGFTLRRLLPLNGPYSVVEAIAAS